jgi:hypothetical protein
MITTIHATIFSLNSIKETLSLLTGCSVLELYSTICFAGAIICPILLAIGVFMSARFDNHSVLLKGEKILHFFFVPFAVSTLLSVAVVLLIFKQ